MTNGKTAPLFIALLCVGLQLALAGCGSEETKKNPDFFTSGNPEADQRAEQRMAKSEELKGADSNKKAAQPDEKKSLYDRLAGDSGIAAITDDFVTRAMADPRVNWDRKDVKQGGFSIHHDRSVTWTPTPQKVQAMKVHISQFLAVATGGPAKYEGREMKDVHAGLHISNAEFDAAAGDLKATLDKLRVPVKEQKELLAIIESTRPEVVEKR
jgi:hemoglobin